MRAGRGRPCGRACSSTSAPVAANAAAARSCQEHEPAPATWRMPPSRRSAISTSAAARWPVNVGQPTWSSTTVSASRSSASRSIVATKLPPWRPNSHDVRTIAWEPGAASRDGELARELRAAVGAERAGGRRLAVRLARGAVEHVVGRDLDDERARRARRGGDVAGAGAVDRGGGRLVGLGAVDVGPGGAVDDGVRPRGGDRGLHGRGVADIELAARQRGDVVSGARGGGGHVVAQHPRRSGHEQAHSARYW